MGLTDMSSSLERGLSVLDLLSTHPEGMAVGQVASALDLPPSGVHRMLNQLVEYGYVHQGGTKSAYVLGMKLPALGLAYLAQSAVPRICYISCNPSSWAKDAAALVAGGYRLVKLRPVGQFRWSTHVELASLFVRG